MAIKVVELPGVGKVRLQKRRGTRSIRLRLSQTGEVVVSQPVWLPYRAGLDFAKRNKDWISKHAKPKKFITPETVVGRAHKLLFLRSTGTKAQARVVDGVIRVHVPAGHEITHDGVQAAARRGAENGLRAEEYILKNRIRIISERIELPYRDVVFKFMKSKWGSCRNDNTITLNYRLLDLPDELVDYVIIHELAHTKHMNHSKNFWDLVAAHQPDHKVIRRQLKNVVLPW